MPIVAYSREDLIRWGYKPSGTPGFWCHRGLPPDQKGGLAGRLRTGDTGGLPGWLYTLAYPVTRLWLTVRNRNTTYVVREA